MDLDAAEALGIADLFLEPTLSGGREGTPRAHRSYWAPGAKTKKWLGGDGGVIVELRSTGCQMLVEPSVRPNGERYAWHRDGVLEPIETSPRDLERRCAELAAAVAVARRLPPVGGRHEYAKAVVGFLLRQLDEEVVLRIVLAAWRAGEGDDPDAVGDLGKIVGDSARRLAAGENAFGAPRLEELAPSLPDLLARFLGRENPEREGEKDAAGTDERVPTHDELRDHWLASVPSPTAYGPGGWLRYGAGFWAPIHQLVVDGEVDRILEAAKPEKVRPTAGMRASVERMARPRAHVPDEAWDANEDILVCANGTLEISVGVLREHRPEDHALGAVPYDYDPAAKAPTWRRFLETTVPEAAPFLQEFAGYCLTTDTAHEVDVWLHGPPGSGKSTYIEGLKGMLGPRAGLLGLAEIQRSRFALAKLPGKTLVVATEQPSDFISVTHVLNAIISGEEVPVEEKFKPAYTFTPTAKLLWAMNDFPRVKYTGDGLFRRVKVVEFPKRDEEDQDQAVNETIKAEGAGILVWALEGLPRLKERGGFEIPEGVRAATEEFKLTNDVPRMFVDEACLTGEGREEQAQPLYDAYRHWCLTNGHKPLSSTKMAAEWGGRLGFGFKRPQGRKVYTGVKVDPGWIGAQGDYPGTR